MANHTVDEPPKGEIATCPKCGSEGIFPSTQRDGSIIRQCSDRDCIVVWFDNSGRIIKTKE